MTSAADQSPYYITTPIYYVNDRPHVGHCYSTLIADALARYHRATGRDTFFLTGTDEHAEKVVESASAHNMTPLQWADKNAAEFMAAFASMSFTNDDFIRTTQPRHTEKVAQYIQQLLNSGDIALGDYSGWYDPSQEEYLTESVAKEHNYLSPVTGKPLVERTEQNYFFNLSAYEDRLLAHIEANPNFILPAARRNEVLGRLKQGLQNVPVSRAIKEGDTPWGITMPGDDNHRIYVWIDALFNYLSTVDTPDREKYWPATVHMLAKDILWFHAVIWPCLLMALNKPLPGTIYAHSFYVREGRKMSKSLGNFIDLPTLDAYAERFSTDTLRWYLITQGPLDATDADFAYAHFVEATNADLANGFGNAHSRVTNMVAKYFDGVLPSPTAAADPGAVDWPTLTAEAVTESAHAAARCDARGMVRAGMAISNAVDLYINDTAPFKLAKDPDNLPAVGVILYNCAEALRIAAHLMRPAMPTKMTDALTRLGDPAIDAPLQSATAWGGLQPGATLTKGDPLFPRADAKDPEPAPASTSA